MPVWNPGRPVAGDQKTELKWNMMNIEGNYRVLSAGLRSNINREVPRLMRRFFINKHTLVSSQLSLSTFTKFLLHFLYCWLSYCYIIYPDITEFRTVTMVTVIQHIQPTHLSIWRHFSPRHSHLLRQSRLPRQSSERRQDRTAMSPSILTALTYFYILKYL